MPIHREFFKYELTEDELAMLLYLVNTFFPSSLGQIDVNMLKCYRLNILQEQITAVKDRVKPDFLHIYQSLCAKFNILK